MKFTLYSDKVFFDEFSTTVMKELGFEFEQVERPYWFQSEIHQIKGHPEIEFNTLEELIEFSKEWGVVKIYDHDLVICLED